MKGTYLRFYMHENVRHRHQLLYEWLLQHARSLGVHGGSAFRAIEGFGRLICTSRHLYRHQRAHRDVGADRQRSPSLI